MNNEKIEKEKTNDLFLVHDNNCTSSRKKKVSTWYLFPGAVHNRHGKDIQHDRSDNVIMLLITHIIFKNIKVDSTCYWQNELCFVSPIKKISFLRSVADLLPITD